MQYVFKDVCGKRRKGFVKNCLFCKGEFWTRIDQEAFYCSRDCARKAARKRYPLTCATCGKEFFRTKSKMKSSRSGFYFCSRQCKDKAQRVKGGIKEIQPPHYSTGEEKYREQFELEELVCARCGYDEFASCVEIHHKDGNHENNKKRNLLPLCRCCHRALHLGLWRLQVGKEMRNT